VRRSSAARDRRDGEGVFHHLAWRHQRHRVRRRGIDRSELRLNRFEHAGNHSASFTHAAANRYYYRVRARNLSTGCSTSSAFSNVVSVLVIAVPQTRYILVAGSTPGNFGSFFKTSLQLYNARSGAISGKLVFHTQTSPDRRPILRSHSRFRPGSRFPMRIFSRPWVSPAASEASISWDAGSSFPVTLARVFNDAAPRNDGLAEEPMNGATRCRPATPAC